MIRNGKLYRDAKETGTLLVIQKNGELKFVSESETSASELLQKGALQGVFHSVRCF